MTYNTKHGHYQSQQNRNMYPTTHEELQNISIHNISNMSVLVASDGVLVSRLGGEAKT